MKGRILSRMVEEVGWSDTEQDGEGDWMEGLPSRTVDGWILSRTQWRSLDGGIPSRMVEEVGGRDTEQDGGGGWREGY